jgi:hypothetical protein
MMYGLYLWLIIAIYSPTPTYIIFCFYMEELKDRLDDQIFSDGGF